MAFFEFRSTGHMDCNQNSTAANKSKVCPSVSKMPESLNMKTASMDYELDISKSFSQLTTSPQNDEELQELNNNASEFQNAFEKPVIQIPHDDMESKEPIENEKEFEKEMMSIVKLVYEILGPDQREATYQKLLKIKISNRSIECEEEVEIPIMYDGNKIGSRRADLIVKLNDKTVYVLELKHVKSLDRKNLSQLKYYMDQFKIPRGMLINFPKIGEWFPDVDSAVKDGFEADVLLGASPKESKAKTKMNDPIPTIISLKNDLISKDLNTQQSS